MIITTNGQLYSHNIRVVNYNIIIYVQTCVWDILSQTCLEYGCFAIGSFAVRSVGATRTGGRNAPEIGRRNSKPFLTVTTVFAFHHYYYIKSLCCVDDININHCLRDDTIEKQSGRIQIWLSIHLEQLRNCDLHINYKCFYYILFGVKNINWYRYYTIFERVYMLLFLLKTFFPISSYF